MTHQTEDLGIPLKRFFEPWEVEANMFPWSKLSSCTWYGAKLDCLSRVGLLIINTHFPCLPCHHLAPCCCSFTINSVVFIVCFCYTY